MNRSYSKIRHIQESNKKLEDRLLREQTNSGETNSVETRIKELGLEIVDASFKKYGFERNDNPPKIRSIYQYVATYDKKPFYQGDITQDGGAGVRILMNTTLKDIALQKCNSKTHDLDKNYIPLNKNNADCILGRLTMRITD